MTRGPGAVWLEQHKAGSRAVALSNTRMSALNAAIAKAQGEILVLTDVRQPLEPPSVARLMENFADPTVGVASGELLIRAGATQQEADIGLYRRFENWIRVSLSSIDSTFGATGSFYAIRRTLAVPKHLRDNHYRGAERLGHGADYQYSHDHPDACHLTGDPE